MCKVTIWKWDFLVAGRLCWAKTIRNIWAMLGLLGGILRDRCEVVSIPMCILISFWWRNHNLNKPTSFIIVLHGAELARSCAKQLLARSLLEGQTRAVQSYLTKKGLHWIQQVTYPFFLRSRKWRKGWLVSTSLDTRSFGIPFSCFETIWVYFGHLLSVL